MPTMSSSGKKRWPTVLLLILFVIILIILLGSYSVIPNFLPFDITLSEYAPFIISGLIIIATKIWLDLMGPLFIHAFSARTKSEADAAAIYQILSYIAWFVALGAVLWIAAGGPEGGMSLLSLGLVSAAAIYVLQGPLLNIVGWAVLVYRGIYTLGDRIKIRDVSGYVTNISIMNTTVREFGGWMSGDTFTGRVASIPNSFVLEANVFNYTKDTNVIWDELEVNVTYESDIANAQRHVLDATEEVAGRFMQKYSSFVKEKIEFSDIKDITIVKPRVLLRLGDYSVRLFAVYFCQAQRRREVRSRIITAVLRRFSEDDLVQIAYPHVEVVPYKHRPFESRTVDIPVESFSVIPSKSKGKAKGKG
ncbi:MAG: mechanosensitive ion channel family protein [Thermoplasmata archaeon]|nr:mechanosensitive ion channel family protein [Thermoplasmata archaeon]